MLYVLVLLVHVLVSLFLIGVILLQGGRGGLSETLGGGAAQSLFGGRTATVLTRLTTGCAAVFMVTCLSLAYLSTIRGRSVIEQIPAVAPGALPLPPGLPAAPPVQTGAAASVAPQQPSAPAADTGTPAVPSEPTRTDERR